MAVLDGCDSKYRTPVSEDRICPKCGEEVEVFTVRGRVVEETSCSCGYVFQEAVTAIITAIRKRREVIESLEVPGSGRQNKCGFRVFL